MENGFSLATLQREHEPWRQYNFGDAPAWHPLLGIVEEMGELHEAKTLEDVKDSLADVVVYMAHLCNASGFDLETIAAVAAQMGYRPSEMKELRQLAHHFLKREQGIRGSREEHTAAIKGALAGIYAILLDTATEYDIDLLKAVEETWSSVKQRDWKKNAQTGT